MKASKYILILIFGIFIGQIWAYYQHKNVASLSREHAGINTLYNKEIIDAFIKQNFPQNKGSVCVIGNENGVFKVRKIK